MDENTSAQKDKIISIEQSKYGFFGFWTKIAIKVKPQRPRCKKFEIWTKMTKMAKPQGPKWQFTLSLSLSLYIYIYIYICIGFGSNENHHKL
ncbi:hypothetical protein Hanom_Chr11g01012921 [Helianthus anomalus]